MKYLLTISALAALSACTVAQPYEKRVLKVVTVTAAKIVTVDTTTTIFVGAGETPKAGNAAEQPARQAVNPQVQRHGSGHHGHHNAHKPAPQNPAPLPASPKPAVPQVQQPAPKVEAPAANPQSPAPAPVAPQVQQPAPKVEAPPANPQSPAPAPAAPKAQEPAPQVQAPADKPAPASEQPSSSSGGGSGPSGGSCAEGGKCKGDITFFDTALGACGSTNDGTVEDVFALAAGMMGPKSNDNPFCGKMATVKLGDKTVRGKLVDKCMGCEGEDIDLSHHMFQQLASEDIGRTQAEWWFD